MSLENGSGTIPPSSKAVSSTTTEMTTLQAAPLEPFSDSSISDRVTDVFPFLQLPRELRDQIYNNVLDNLDTRGVEAARIERRHLVHFEPTAANFLVVLHHDSICLNRQVAAEALEVLLKHHTVFLSCGPFVLKKLLLLIAESDPGKTWLKWLRKIELDWVTFPNLRWYPPSRTERESWWTIVDKDIQNEYVHGTRSNGNYNEEYLWDYDGEGYDDNFYEAANMSLHPSLDHGPALPTSDDDPFGISTHYPFSDPAEEPTYDVETQDELYTKLDLLIDLEVRPLFAYLSTSVFALSSITIPLYFISKPSLQHRHITRPGSSLPLRLRYWVQVVVHALLMLNPLSGDTPAKLDEVRVKYMSKDVWAAMEPCDDLTRMAKDGIFPNDDDEDREGEGEAFKAVKAELAKRGVKIEEELDVKVKLVRWQGDLDMWKVGDELDVTFTRADKANRPPTATEKVLESSIP